MFDELSYDDDIAIERDMSDREILFHIVRLTEVGDLSGATAADGWSLLAERHPTDLRFLLLVIYQTSRDAEDEVLLRLLVRLVDAAPADLRAAVTDVLADVETRHRWEEPMLRREWEQLLARWPENAAPGSRGRLHRLAADVVKDCHDRWPAAAG